MASKRGGKEVGVAYADQFVPKSTTGNSAIGTALILRYLDIITDLILLVKWANDDAWDKFIIQIVIMGVLGLASGFIAFIRQKSFERQHAPVASGVLGFVQLQLLVEYADSAALGNKTTCLKMLLYYGVMLQSIPDIVWQSYIGWNENAWDSLLFLSVLASLANTSITLISAEKEQYYARGLGKLAVFSRYSLVLAGFRFLELPSRMLSLTLFTAEFGWYIVLLLLIDFILLRILRYSTHKRIKVKKEAAKEKLQRSLAAMNKSTDDIHKLAEIMDDDVSGVENFSPMVLVGHLLMWIFVHLDGIDIYPYVGLRMLEEAAMCAIFGLSLRSDVSAQYQSWMLVILLILMLAHLFYSAVWAYYRSHADFLRPQKSKEEIRMKVRALVKKVEDESVSDSEKSESESDEEPLPIPKVKQPPTPVKRPEPEPEPEPSSTDSSVLASDDDDEFDLPNNVMTEVIVKEVPVVVQIPAVSKRTQGVQYDWNDIAKSQAQPNEQDIVVDLIADAENGAADGTRASCAADAEEQCIVQ